MLGKRPRPTMRRTSSVSLIGSGSVNGDGSPLPEHPPKEKLKSSNNNCPSPPSSAAAAHRQVIGFHPKVFIDDELDLSSAPASPRRASQQSSKSPAGSPRSGLGDLLAGSRPWEKRKDEGVGLGIVAALSGSQEEVGKVREEGRVYSSTPTSGGGGGAAAAYPSRKTPSQAHPHMPSVFAPSRASPPIPILVSSSNSGYPCPSHCTEQYCSPAAAFGLAPSSVRPESMFLESSNSNRDGSRHNLSSSSAAAAAWARPNNVHDGVVVGITWGHHADMDVDKIDPFTLMGSPLVHGSARHSIPTSSAGFTPNFLDACHLCRRHLGEGRDIYIYRGDRAFCSPECRHQQIVNDERPEKCSSAVMKMGGSDARGTTQRNRVIAAGTAAAA